jgi:uncharacterized protein YndB with AHSA1/START domain
MKQAVTLEVFYPHSVERVWQALTDRRALTAWMMDNDFEPRLGHKFYFRYPTLPGFDTFVRCEVIAIEPPQLLVYRWQDPQTHKSTIVRWSLTAVAGGTTLQLQHDLGFHTTAIHPSVMRSPSSGLHASLQYEKEYESPMNKLVMGALDGCSQTQESKASFTTLAVEYCQPLQVEWSDRLTMLSQELNSSNIATS